MTENEKRLYIRYYDGDKTMSLCLTHADLKLTEHYNFTGSRMVGEFSGSRHFAHKINTTPEKKVIQIKKVYFNPPYTIVIWDDDTKSKIKCQDGDIYDPEKGLALAISKKALGNKGSWYEIFKKFISPADLESEPKPAPADKPKYKVGDKVLIKKVDPRSGRYSWFDSLKGRVIEISTYDEETTVDLKVESEGYWFPEDWIEKKVEE